MHQNLQEILELLQEEFPKVKEKSLIKIIFSLKSRVSLYSNWNIGFSRTEYVNFGLSEATLQKIIYFLRDYWILEKVWIKKITPKNPTEFKYCNIYKIADFFLDLLKDLEFFTRKVFEYINPIEFMRKYFKFTFKYWLYKFKHNWNRYYINTKWKFKNVIFWETEQKIINPLFLL